MLLSRDEWFLGQKCELRTSWIPVTVACESCELSNSRKHEKSGRCSEDGEDIGGLAASRARSLRLPRARRAGLQISQRVVHFAPFRSETLVAGAGGCILLDWPWLCTALRDRPRQHEASGLDREGRDRQGE